MSNTSDNTTMFADGFDDAILGLCTCPQTQIKRVVYDKARMIRVLRKRDGMDYDTALEFLEHNTWTAYVGKGTPIYVDVMTASEIKEHVWKDDDCSPIPTSSDEDWAIDGDGYRINPA